MVMCFSLKRSEVLFVSIWFPPGGYLPNLCGFLEKFVHFLRNVQNSLPHITRCLLFALEKLFFPYTRNLLKSNSRLFLSIGNISHDYKIISQVILRVALHVSKVRKMY